MVNVMGTIRVGSTTIMYDSSGGTVVDLPSGTRCVFQPDMQDASLFVMASAMGYGRQVGRDRILMHCLLAEAMGTVAEYLAVPSQTWRPWPWFNRVDMLLCHLNQVSCVQQPYGPEDAQAMLMAEQILWAGVRNTRGYGAAA